jgi:DNA-damage-inducible protein D
MEFPDFSAELDGKKLFTEEGVEYWQGRDLQLLLGYDAWHNFAQVIEKAIHACESVGVDPSYHFYDTVNMIVVGKGALAQRADCFLTRYACYLIAMNGDSRKVEIGMAQTYFAVQTRRQEKYDELTEAEKRIALRKRVKDHNKHLFAAAQKAGVQNFPKFQGEGYKGLYGGLGVREVKALKRIPAKDDLLDCVNRAELAAHDFRITQTEEKLTGVQGEDQATRLHYSVGAEVRNAIKKIGGKMPETLPAEPNIKLLVKEQKKRAKELTGKKPNTSDVL